MVDIVKVKLVVQCRECEVVSADVTKCDRCGKWFCHNCVRRVQNSITGVQSVCGMCWASSGNGRK